MEITSPTLDAGPSTPEFTRNLSRVKFELTSYNPYEVEIKKPPWISRIFSAVGNFAHLGLFFGPPGWVAGAGAAGLGALGNKAKQNHLIQQAQAAQTQQSLVMATPGLGISPGVESPELSLISTYRNDALYSSSQAVK